MTTKRIVRLRWHETSGVDDPANEDPGWAVMKSRDSEAVDTQRFDDGSEVVLRKNGEFVVKGDILSEAFQAAHKGLTRFQKKENPMTDDNEGFKAFKKRIEGVMATIPEEQHGEFLSILVKLADRVDRAESRSHAAALKKAVGDALDRLSKAQEGSGLDPRREYEVDPESLDRALRAAGMPPVFVELMKLLASAFWNQPDVPTTGASSFPRQINREKVAKSTGDGSIGDHVEGLLRSAAVQLGGWGGIQQDLDPKAAFNGNLPTAEDADRAVREHLARQQAQGGSTPLLKTRREIERE